MGGRRLVAEAEKYKEAEELITKLIASLEQSLIFSFQLKLVLLRCSAALQAHRLCEKHAGVHQLLRTLRDYNRWRKQELIRISRVCLKKRLRIWI